MSEIPECPAEKAFRIYKKLGVKRKSKNICCITAAWPLLKFLFKACRLNPDI
jgi:hypothetical protein